MTIEIPRLLQFVFVIFQFLLFPVLGEPGPTVVSKPSDFAVECFKLREKVPNTFMGDLARDLEKRIPKGVFLHKLEYNLGYDDPEFKFSFTGTATNSEAVFETIKSLGQSGYFISPSIESTEEVPLTEKDYFLIFRITGRIVKPK